MTATANRKPATRKPPAEPAFQAPESKPARPRKPAAVQPELVTPPQQERLRPTEHNGVAIVSETRIGFFRQASLELADGSTAFACWDCTYTSDSRGDVMTHRNAAHGTNFGRPNRRKDGDFLDLILPDRSDGTRPGDSPRDWTIGEILAVMPTIRALGDHIEDLERRNAELEELSRQSRVSRADQHKIDVYETHQAEIGQLRAWKKKMIAKLESLGFRLSEEDQ